MLRDRATLLRTFGRMQKRQAAGQPVSNLQAQLLALLESSGAEANKRRASIPDIELADLPIASVSDEVQQLLVSNQVIVLAGETGSGKTTQLPKICLQAGRGIYGRIAHTQPRRVAARSVAQRIASELDCALGSLVGYQVRFTDNSQPETLIKLMTDGILLAEIQRDLDLMAYDTLIIDEAHERSLNIDFLLGYLQQLLRRRPELRLIVTSATIDEQSFADFFGGAPVVKVGGRTWPVDIRYLHEPRTDSDRTEQIAEAVQWCVEQPAPAREARDVLVFLSGEREIRETADLLRKQGNHYSVLPLYSRLNVADQDKVFRPTAQRRVILATNVAETSITVPGVGFVVDPGEARISRFSARSGIRRLPVEAISQASAQQRAGRAGRIAPGICLRLYTEEDYIARPAYTDPEIRRTNLAAVILRMAGLRLGDIRDFPFPEPPDSRQIHAGITQLQELQLLDGQGALTGLGKQLAPLPLDPPLARIIYEGAQRDCLRELLVIVSALSVQDPRDRPADKRQQADEKHRQFVHEKSDFLSWLNIWDAWNEQRELLPRRQLSRWCEQNYLSPARMFEWRDIHRQLHILVVQEGWRENIKAAEYRQIHEALLTGLLSRIGFRRDNNEYLGARNRPFFLFPGSGQFKQRPKWVVAAEMIETKQLYAHQVAAIEPEWLPPLAEHLIQKEYLEPQYSERRGEVTARERISLFGLLLSEDKRVSYKSIEPQLCRQIFIRQALVEGKYKTKAPWQRHNLKLMEELRELERRARRVDICPDDAGLFAFFSALVDASVCDRASFERWRRHAETRNQQVLFLDREHWLRRANFNLLDQFPDHIDWKGIRYPLRYEFDPLGKSDGVTLELGLEQLAGCPPHLGDWLVPGLLLEKVEKLLRTLPKTSRRQLQPVADRAMDFIAACEPSDQPLTTAICSWLHKSLGLRNEESDFDPSRLDDFYRMNYRLLDGEGKKLIEERTLSALQSAYRQNAQAAVADMEITDESERRLSNWPEEGVPEFVDRRYQGRTVRLWPGLEDNNDVVLLRHFEHPQRAADSSRRGLARLYLLQMAQACKYLRKELFRGQELALTPLGHRDKWVDLILLAAANSLITTPLYSLRSSSDFQQQLETISAAFVPRAMELEKLLLQITSLYRPLSARIDALAGSFKEVKDDARAQLDRLLDSSQFLHTPMDWQKQVPRYLQGLDARLDKLQSRGLDKDLEALALVQKEMNRWQQLCQFVESDTGNSWPQLVEYRWLIEEYRISLFAQPMKTLRPVSQKRLDVVAEKLEIAKKLAMVHSPN